MLLCLLGDLGAAPEHTPATQLTGTEKTFEVYVAARSYQPVKRRARTRMLRFTGSAAPPSLDVAAFARTASRAEAAACLGDALFEVWEAECGCSTHRVRCSAGALVRAGRRANFGATTAHRVHAIVATRQQDNRTADYRSMCRGWRIVVR